MKIKMAWGQRQLPSGKFVMELYVLTEPDTYGVQRDCAVIFDLYDGEYVEADDVSRAFRKIWEKLHQIKELPGVAGTPKPAAEVGFGPREKVNG